MCCLLGAEAARPLDVPATSSPLILAGTLPFSRLDLEQAITVRLLEGAKLPGQVQVTALAPDRMEVRLGARRRILEVDSTSGQMVARLVALSVMDLLMETTPEPLHTAEAARLAVRGAPASLRLAAMPSWGHGLQGSETSIYAITASATIRRGRWLADTSVGYWWSPTARAGRPGESRFFAWPVRADFGVTIRGFEVWLGPMVAPYSVRGSIPRAGVLVGVGPRIARAWSLWRGLRAMAEIGCDIFANRTATRVGGTDVTFASPRLAPWAGAGLGWEIGS